MKLKHLSPNCTELSFESGVCVLFSYETPVAAFIPTLGLLTTETKHSTTTSKHINVWCKVHFSDATQRTTKPQEYFDSLVNPLDLVTQH